MYLDEFWDIVEAAGWARSPGDLKSAKENLILKLTTPRKIELFHQSVLRKRNELDGSFLAWLYYNKPENEQNIEYYGLSEEDYNNLLYHIVGLGREVFEDAYDHPEHMLERALKRDFANYFVYSLPYTKSMYEIFEDNGDDY